MGFKLGFIGAGQMAKALGLPLVQKGFIDASKVFVSCPEPELLRPWKEVGCHTTEDNGEVVTTSDVLMWAVKPQIFPQAIQSTDLSKVSPGSKKLHVSIMAGVTLQTFSSSILNQFHQLKNATARIMPNIGMKVNSGCCVYACDDHCTKEDKSVLTQMLENTGLCFEVQESQINAYCGLFGSGIGFMFPILEAMSDGAVKMGIPREISLKIAAQTMKGAAELVLTDQSHPGALKDSVCSPGGTTITGIAELEKLGVRNAIIAAIEAATQKGDELGKLD